VFHVPGQDWTGPVGLGLWWGSPSWWEHVVGQNCSPSERKGGSQGPTAPSRTHPNDLKLPIGPTSQSFHHPRIAKPLPHRLLGHSRSTFHFYPFWSKAASLTNRLSAMSSCNGGFTHHVCVWRPQASCPVLLSSRHTCTHTNTHTHTHTHTHTLTHSHTHTHTLSHTSWSIQWLILSNPPLLLFLPFLLLVFWDSSSLSCPGWPWTLKSPASDFKVLGL
jgi:hypothetical protein